MVAPGGVAVSYERGTPVVPRRDREPLLEIDTPARRFYLTERIDQTVSVKSIYPQTRQLDFVTRNSEIKLTGVWVN